LLPAAGSRSCTGEAWVVHASSARGAATLGVVQLESTLDSLQPALDTVDPPRLAGEITMQVGELSAIDRRL